MTSDEIKLPLERAEELVQGKEWGLNLFSDKRLKMMQIRATWEAAYQSARLFEMLERKVINVLPTPESNGRLFKE